MKTLTPKQERFCQEIVVGQTLSAAYGVAFAPKTMSKKTINEKACRLAKMGKIGARITRTSGARGGTSARDDGEPARRVGLCDVP